MQIDIRAMELLASRLCHDLVSPVSAINNGVELIQDIGGDVVDEAMKLIGNSAEQASRRLRLFRFAYGRAGSEENATPKDVRQVVMQYMAGGKLNLTWAETALDEKFSYHRGALKVLVNALMLAEETLAYGGSISLYGDGSTCRIEIAGRAAQLAPPFQAALDGTAPVDEVTARTIQAYITGKFAEHFGIKVSYSQPVPDRLDMTLAVAAV